VKPPKKESLVNITIPNVNLECNEVADFDPEDLKKIMEDARPPEGQTREAIDLHELLG
jgi:hypothetical protein